MKVELAWMINLLMVAALSISGCQDGSEELMGKKSDNAQVIQITMIGKSTQNPVFLSAREGAEAAVKDLNNKHSSIDVRLNWQTPEVEDPARQVEILRAAEVAGTDAILISCSDKDSLSAAINAVVKSGISVMTFDSDAPESGRFAFFGPDDREMGRQVLKELARLLDGKGKIAILGGNQEAPNLIDRVNGIKEAVKEYPDLEIIGTFFHGETESAAVEAMMDAKRKHPDLAGWAMVGGWATFGSMLMENMQPGEVKIVAVDALPQQLVYIEKGYVQALMGQPTYMWGKIGIETIVDKVHFGKDVKEIIKMNNLRYPITVTIKNLGGWSRQLRAWGYQGLSDDYLVM